MSEASNCPKCGAAIPPEAPQGLCPKCLLSQASFPTETGPGTRHSRPLPPSRDELAKAFPHLEILELIGQGGMGFVFKARQAKLDRHVALKILAQPLAEQAAFAERFTREGRTLAKLSHPNIVTIHDFGQAGPFFYLLMEYVDGVNLRQAMRAAAITADQALAIVPKICEALQYAHNEGVLHRDIKPDNILLDTRGRVKIADFGIAKLMAEAAAENPLTGAGASLGTPHYMAPEQIERPNTVDHRADIFSLGVVFYEMLTGELPLGRFAAPSHKGSDPRLDDVVLQTLEKQPDRRPQSAQEVRTKVEDIAQKPLTAPATSTPKKRTTARVLVTIAVVLAGAFVLLAGSFILYANLRRRAVPADYWQNNLPPTELAVPTAAPDKLTEYAILSEKLNQYYKKDTDLRKIYTDDSVLVKENKNSIQELESHKKQLEIQFPALLGPAQASGPARKLERPELSLYERTINLKTPMPLFAGEEIVPVIRFGQDAWSQNELAFFRRTWRNDASNSVSSSYTWALPEPFTAFDVMAALERARAAISIKPVELIPGQETIIFSATNGFQQIITGGLRYVRQPNLMAPDSSRAILRAKDVGYALQTESRHIIAAYFDGEIPAGTMIQTTAVDADGNPYPTQQTTLQHNSLTERSFRMEFEEHHVPIHRLKAEILGKRFELPLNKRMQIFSITNYDMAARPTDTPQRIISIVNGFLELKRLPLPLPSE